VPFVLAPDSGALTSMYQHVKADFVEQSHPDEIGKLNSMPPGSSIASRQSSRPGPK
jgi:hypothetical protein